MRKVNKDLSKIDDKVKVNELVPLQLSDVQHDMMVFPVIVSLHGFPHVRTTES